MKKLLSIVVMLLCCLSMSAQEHIKFMGIPVDGTPAQFEQKLIAKGFKHKLTHDTGYRIVSGTFSGQECYVYINCNAAKIVDYVAVCIINGKSQTLRMFESFEEKLDRKYEYLDCVGEGLDRRVECSADGGTIAMFIEDLYNHSYRYKLYIAYYDIVNMNKGEQAELDDL